MRLPQQKSRSDYNKVTRAKTINLKTTNFTIFFIIIEVENYGWFMVYNKSDACNDANKINVGLVMNFVVKFVVRGHE